MIYRFIVFVMAGVFCLSTSDGVGIFNGDFEFGEPNQSLGIDLPVGWQTENYTAIVSNFVPQPVQGNTSNWQIDVVAGLDPNYGQSFVVLSTGDVIPDPRSASMSQQIEVGKGWTISGYYFFGTCDYSPYSDYATIKMVSEPNSSPRDIILVDITVEDVNSYGSMPGWGYFEYVFGPNDPGTYELTIEVVDKQDAIYKSYFAVDHLKLRCGPQGDINIDCAVDMLDYALLCDDWAIDCSDPNIDCSATDLSRDGVIDANDLSILIDHWLGSQ